MNSKSIAFLFLGLIFMLAGVFNVVLQHAPSFSLPSLPSGSVSGLFGKFTGLFTHYLSNPSKSYIQTNLTTRMSSVQELQIASSTAITILIGGEQGSMEVSQLIGNPFQLELHPFSQVELKSYTGNLMISDGVELDGTAEEISSTTISFKSKKNPIRLEAYSLPFLYIQMKNVTITNLNLQNVEGTVVLSWEKESITHRIEGPRKITLDRFEGDMIINGTRIILEGKATYRPNLLIMPNIGG